jgi:hypothetical protein
VILHQLAHLRLRHEGFGAGPDGWDTTPGGPPLTFHAGADGAMERFISAVYRSISRTVSVRRRHRPTIGGNSLAVQSGNTTGPYQA